jgi:hypothetical protein
VPDHDIEHLTVGTHFRTRKHELAKALNVLVDKASKVGYNDHALQPDSKDAVKLNPSSRAVPFSRMESRAYTIPEQTKRPSRMDGLMHDGGEYL